MKIAIRDERARAVLRVSKGFSREESAPLAERRDPCQCVLKCLYFVEFKDQLVFIIYDNDAARSDDTSCEASYEFALTAGGNATLPPPSLSDSHLRRTFDVKYRRAILTACWEKLAEKKNKLDTRSRRIEQINLG